MVNVQLDDAEINALNDGANRAFRVGRGLVELSDLRQEAYLWALEHPRKVLEWREHEKKNAALRIAAYHTGLDYLRAQQRVFTGSRKSDQATYSAKTVADLLPVLFDYDDWSQPGQPDDGDVRAPSRPDEGNTYLTLICEVKGALEKLSEGQQELLVKIYRDAISYDLLAESYDVHQSTIRRREASAITAIIDLLGGPAVLYRRRKA